MFLMLLHFRCSVNFVGDIVSSGGVAELLTLYTHSETTVAHQSSTLLFRLLNHPQARPVFGAAGGVTQFIEILTDWDGNVEHDMENMSRIFSILNVVCMCCKDVVNRVKIREQGGLLMLLAFLKSGKLKNLHERIISALQCFLYDEASIEILLEADLVTTLMEHLKTICSFESSTPETDHELGSFIEDEHLNDAHNYNKKKDCEINAKDENTCVEIGENLKTELVIKNPERSEEDILDIEKEVKENTPNEINNTKKKKKDHVYSIDSPTYKATSNWMMPDNSSGDIKCKQSFSPMEAGSYKSPLSTISYYSPSLSPGDFSPCTSPTTSSSQVNEDPDYPFVCSVSYMCGSPEKPKQSDSTMSPGGYSPNQSTANVSQGELIFSESEEEEMEMETNVKMIENENENLEPGISLSSENSGIQNSTDMGVDVDMKSASAQNVTSIISNIKDTDDILSGKHKSLRSSPSPDDIDYQLPKRRKLDPETFRFGPTLSENHILMIVSRISQMSDPSKYLMKSNFVDILLDYIAKVDKAELRAARILSRLAKNPHCFEKFIQMRIPLVIYKKLLSSSENASNWAEIVYSDGLDLKGEAQPRCRSRSNSGPTPLPRSRNTSSSSFSEDSFLDVYASPDSTKTKGIYRLVLSYIS